MIANIVYSSGSKHKGPQLVHQLITQALKEGGLEVDEYFLTGDTYSTPSIAGPAIITSPRVARRKGVWRYMASFALTKKLLRLLDSRNTKVVICDGIGVMRHLVPVLAKKANLKLIVVVHMLVKFNPRDLALIKEYEDRIRIITVSDFVASELRILYPQLQNILKAIPNTLDPNFSECLYERFEARSFLGLPKDKFLFVVASRLAGQKDVATVIKAFERANRNDACLVIIGDGPDTAGLKMLVDTLAIHQSVIWLGWIESASRYFKAFDVYVSAAIVEGFGLSVLEGSAAGLPVLCTKIPPHQEMLGCDGVFFNVGDIDECAKKMSLDLGPASACDLKARYRLFAEEYRWLVKEMVSSCSNSDPRKGIE